MIIHLLLVNLIRDIRLEYYSYIYMDKNNVDLLKKVKIRDGVYAYFYKSNVKNKKYKVGKLG